MIAGCDIVKNEKDAIIKLNKGVLYEGYRVFLEKKSKSNFKEILGGIRMDTLTVERELVENDKTVRNMVLAGLQEVKEGKGEEYTKFFDKLEKRIKNERV